MAWTLVGTLRPVIPTYATTADAEDAITSGDLVDGSLLVILDAS